MQIAFTGFLLTLALIANAAAVAGEEPCGTQREKADAALNETYRSILKDPAYAKKPAFLKALKQAEQAWVKFRDLALEARYPGDDKNVLYGSANPDCRCRELLRMTEARLAELKIWTTGIEEGDSCTGSVKRK